jgi:hypothetical protein
MWDMRMRIGVMLDEKKGKRVSRWRNDDGTFSYSWHNNRGGSMYARRES